MCCHSLLFNVPLCVCVWPRVSTHIYTFVSFETVVDASFVNFPILYLGNLTDTATVLLPFVVLQFYRTVTEEVTQDNSNNQT